jgi:glycosyltransferase involved in cell wall biosynthesis
MTTTSKRTVVLIGGGPIIAGKEIMLLTLGRGLRNLGYGVKFITSVWGGKGDFVARLKSEGFDFSRVRLGFISIAMQWKPFIWTLDQLRYWPSLVIGYLGAIKRAAPTAVVHTNWHHALLLLPFLNRHRDIYWSHEIVPVHRRYAVVFRAISARVAAMVCVSNAVGRELLALGIDPAKIIVIHNSVLVDAVRSQARTTPPLRLGIIGQIGVWKGHGDVLDALAMLPNAAEDVVLKIFGTGDARYIAELKAKAATLGLTDRIEWSGFVSDTQEILGQIDVCLMPSRHAEAFGLSALEAGIGGRPVICTDTGGLPEVVEGGETGYIVEKARPDQLAHAIERFLQRPELVAVMGEAGRNRAFSQFCYSRFIERFVQLIDGLQRHDSNSASC